TPMPPVPTRRSPRYFPATTSPGATAPPRASARSVRACDMGCGLAGSITGRSSSWRPSAATQPDQAAPTSPLGPPRAAVAHRDAVFGGGRGRRMVVEERLGHGGRPAPLGQASHDHDARAGLGDNVEPIADAHDLGGLERLPRLLDVARRASLRG